MFVVFRQDKTMGDEEFQVLYHNEDYERFIFNGKMYTINPTANPAQRFFEVPFVDLASDNFYYLDTTFEKVYRDHEGFNSKILKSINESPVRRVFYREEPLSLLMVSENLLNRPVYDSIPTFEGLKKKVVDTELFTDDPIGMCDNGKFFFQGTSLMFFGVKPDSIKIGIYVRNGTPGGRFSLEQGIGGFILNALNNIRPFHKKIISRKFMGKEKTEEGIVKYLLNNAIEEFTYCFSETIGPQNRLYENGFYALQKEYKNQANALIESKMYKQGVELK